MYPLLILLLLAVLKAIRANPCVAFDSNFNLLVFGLDSKDYNAGTQDAWSANKSATEITTTGRPPFDGSSTTCYLSQYTNAIYVMGADSANPASVYIYDATSKSWTTQSINPTTFDPSSFVAILDHDTNVFYALSKGELFTLDMSTLKAAQSSAISWTDVVKAPLPDGYQPVMGLAQNHIHFLDVPGVPAGSAQIFVIHFSYFQPAVQSYPGAGGGDSFPATHGQAISLFQQDNTAQKEFAFIPDDGSDTYVINVVNNSTQTLAGPPTKDANAAYAGAVTSIVQLTSAGAVSYIPYQAGDSSAISSAKWSPVGPIMAIARNPPSNSTGPSGAKSTGSQGPSPTSASQTKNSGVSSRRSGAGWILALPMIATTLIVFGFHSPLTFI